MGKVCERPFRDRWWIPVSGIFWFLQSAFVLLVLVLSVFISGLTLPDRPADSWFDLIDLSGAIFFTFSAAVFRFVTGSMCFRLTNDGLVVSRFFIGERVAIEWAKLDRIELDPGTFRLTFHESTGRSHKIPLILYDDPYRLRKEIVERIPKGIYMPPVPNDIHPIDRLL